MPAIDSDLLPAPSQTYRFSLEPAYNALYSIMLLDRIDELSGLGEWVERTAVQLGAAGRHRNRLVMNGLHFAVIPERSFPSFWSYLEYMASVDPVIVRDRLTHKLWSAYPHAPVAGAPPPPQQPNDMLASLDSYIGFLQNYWDGCDIDMELESEAYSYLIDPPRMQRLIVNHLRGIWEEGLSSEWERIRPLLQESVDASRRINLSDLRPAEAIQRVVGQAPAGKWEAILSQTEQIVFVPSAHIGPYVGKFFHHGVMTLIGGMHLPTGMLHGGSALSRSDLLVRLGALTDDTRLRILALLVEQGELCAPEIMVKLDLSQSAVSRHLRQIGAAGYVSERWHDGSKCYQLNRERIGDTLAALERFFGEQRNGRD